MTKQKLTALQLSNRRHQAFGLKVKGYTVREIAEELNISPSVVHHDIEDLNSIERLGVTLIADLYMNICGLEGLEDYAKVWLLPSQQREIWLDYARANPDTVNPFINLSDPETGDFIQFEI